MPDYAEGLHTAVAVALVHEEQAEAFSAELAANPNAKPGAAMEWEHRAEEATAIARDLQHALEATTTSTSEPHTALLDRATKLCERISALQASLADAYLHEKLDRVQLLRVELALIALKEVPVILGALLARIDSLDRATVAILDKHADQGRELAACRRRAEDAEYALFTATAVRWQRLHVPPLHPQASCLPCLPPDGESCVICSGDGYDLGHFVAETMRWESIDDAMGPISDYDGCWFLVLSPPVADGETT